MRWSVVGNLTQINEYIDVRWENDWYCFLYYVGIYFIDASNNVTIVSVTEASLCIVVE